MDNRYREPAMHDAKDRATELLDRMAHGDQAAADALYPLVYQDMRGLARLLYRGDEAARTLNPTALVHEVYLRLARDSSREYEGHKHFMRVAMLAMRQLLRDSARSKNRVKRGGGAERVTLSGVVESGSEEVVVDLLDLEQALVKLGKLSERQARVVELRFFGGLNIPETASVLEVSERTVQLDWQLARAWLSRELKRLEADDQS